MDNWNRLSLLPARELRQIQNRKLRNFISYQLYPFSPYYRRLFDRHKIKPEYIKTVEDLSLIPFTKKEDFLATEDNPNRFRDFILQPDEALIKRHWKKSRLLRLVLLKGIRGEEYLKRRFEREYRPIFLTATTGTTNQPVSFLYSDYDIENLRIFGYRALEVFGVKGEIRGGNLFP